MNSNWTGLDKNARLFYGSAVNASAQTLLGRSAAIQHLGAQIGVIRHSADLGQNLVLHSPQSTCAIPPADYHWTPLSWIRPDLLSF